MYLLISHQCKSAPKWVLDAAWDKFPKFSQIMELRAFNKKTPLDYRVAKSIIDHSYIGIYQSEKPEDVFEYLLIEHHSGDTNLGDYFLTGYYDLHELTEDCIIGPSAFQYLLQDWAEGMELTLELVGLGSGQARIIKVDEELILDVDNQPQIALNKAKEHKDFILLRN